MKARAYAEEAKMKENLKKIECFFTESFFYSFKFIPPHKPSIALNKGVGDEKVASTNKALCIYDEF